MSKNADGVLWGYAPDEFALREQQVRWHRTLPAAVADGKDGPEAHLVMMDEANQLTVEIPYRDAAVLSASIQGLFWEGLSGSFRDKKSSALQQTEGEIRRAPIPGGWLVLANGIPTFVPDPGWKWNGTSADFAEAKIESLVEKQSK